MRWIGIVLLCCGCSAAAWGQTDGFGDTIAIGCTTVTRCRELEAAARVRTRHCAANTIGIIRCQDAAADLVSVRRLLSAAEDDDAQRVSRVHQEKVAADRREDMERADADRATRAAEHERAAEALRDLLDASKRSACRKQKAQRDEYRVYYDERVAEIAAKNARLAIAAKWIARHCFKRSTPIFEARAFVDAGGFVKIGRVIVDHDEETVCPASAPPDVIGLGKLEKEGGSYVGEWPALDEPATAIPYEEKPVDSDCNRPDPSEAPAAPPPSKVSPDL